MNRFAALSAAALLVGCGTNVYETAYPTLSDGRYDSEFPYRSSSRQLADLSRSVRMLNSVAYYTTFVFDPEEGVERSRLTREYAEEHAASVRYVTNTSSGTATLIHRRGRRVAVVTTAHIIDFPGRVVTAFRDDPGHVQTASFKDRQVNYVPAFPDDGRLEIVALDRERDIAVLGREFSTPVEGSLPEFPHPAGAARELEWGTFVYVAGFPMGYAMITKGTVSSPNRDDDGAFLIDAPFNRGFSGGVVVAIRDGVPNFELVGMAKSVVADFGQVLVPEGETAREAYDPGVPYRGEVYVKPDVTIRYGITNVIPVEAIRAFMELHRREFEEAGYRFDPKYFPSTAPRSP